MRFALTAVFVAITANSPCAQTVVAKDNPFHVQESAFSVKETLDRLTAALETKGIKVVVRVDHAAGAKAVGMELPPTEVLMFGNPKLGTPLMQANPLIGLDLPMKVLAWQDKTGQVYVGYTKPADLKIRYGITERDEPFKAMENALLGITGEALRSKSMP